jgi:hypothetical protein
MKALIKRLGIGIVKVCCCELWTFQKWMRRNGRVIVPNLKSSVIELPKHPRSLLASGLGRDGA